MGGSQPRLHALTSLRFFAALHVLAFHIQGSRPLPLPAPVVRLVEVGFVSVSFFFVLSGFILTVSYASRPPHQHLRQYAVGRFARIYPLYALGLLAMAPFWFRQASIGSSLSTLTLMQSWFPSWALSWNPPAWSLSVEAFFYAVFPWALPSVLRASLPRLWSVAIGGWVLGLLLSGVYVWTQPDGLIDVDDSSSGFWLSALKFHPLVRLPEFVLGMVLGRSFLEGRWPSLKIAGAVAAVLLGVVLMYSQGIPFPLLHNGVLTPLFVVIVAAAAQNGLAPFHHALSHRWLVRLGEASYALYILQTPLLSLVSGVGKRLWPAALESRLSFEAMTVVLTTLASLVAWALIEKPARQWLIARLGGVSQKLG